MSTNKPLDSLLLVKVHMCLLHFFTLSPTYYTTSLDV